MNERYDAESQINLIILTKTGQFSDTMDQNLAFS